MLDDPADFYALPPALRRKLFSNVERCRLEQRHADARPWTGCSSSSASPEPKHRFRRRRPALLAAPADCAWFRSLPPKVQQQHFSREERARFALVPPSGILDAADEALLLCSRRRRRGHGRSASVSVLSSSSSSSSSALSLASTAQADSAVAMDDAATDGFRWLDDDDDDDDDIDINNNTQTHNHNHNHNLSLDLRLDYHASLAPTASTTPASASSLRRTFSLSSRSRRRASISSPPTALSSSASSAAPAMPAKTHRRALSRPLPPPPLHLAASSIDLPAQYYQDPEARLKLRVYLASPQKFDEAVEFGFPALHLRDSFDARLSLDSDWNFQPDDDDDSLNNNTGDERSMHKQMQPPTCLPSESNPCLSALDVTAGTRPCTPKKSPMRPRLVSNGPSQSAIGSREMTLKMTLTRPDLRTAAEPSLPASPALPLTPVSVSAAGATTTTTTTTTGSSCRDSEHRLDDDPLRLADLPAADEDLHIWDSPDDDRGVVKKLLRRFKRRN
ncbi:hypothetical protein LOY97_006479 [Ophidiomyces ophidiicola]|nr:hypothetical protein LOY97_006479 [Ophidiomyces ophidiicola]